MYSGPKPEKINLNVYSKGFSSPWLPTRDVSEESGLQRENTEGKGRRTTTTTSKICIKKRCSFVYVPLTHDTECGH